MELKPIYTEVDYKEVLFELMALEAYGLLMPSETLYIEIMSELLDYFEAQHNPEHWYHQHRNNNSLLITPFIKNKEA
jgi:hypothetical protein